MNLFTKQKHTNYENLWLQEMGVGGWREGTVREFGMEMDMDTLLYFKWRTDKDLLTSTGNSAPCYVAAWLEAEFGGEGIHECVWLRPFAVHLKPSQHCLSGILQ